MLKQNRYLILDIGRGIAVLWMMIFHFCYDLRLFGWPSVPLNWDWFWYWFPRLIVASFLFVMGASWVHARRRETDLKAFYLRFAKLSAAAILVSVTTYILFPERWVYFGTLHCIAFCSLALFLFEGRKKLALLTILVLISLEFLDKRPPWFDLEHASMDYIPPFPWLIFALLGFLSAQQWTKIVLPSVIIKVMQPVATLGKHSLKIYLIHQPVIFGCFWLINEWLKLH